MMDAVELARAIEFTGRAVLPLVAVGLAAMAILGRRDPSRPVCAGCAGSRDAWSDAACPACGRARVRAATRRPWWTLLVVAAIVFVASRGMTPLADAVRSVALAQQRTSDRELFERVAVEPWPGGISAGVLLRRLERGSIPPSRFRALVLDALARSGGSPAGGLQALAIAGLHPSEPQFARAVIDGIVAPPSVTGSMTSSGLRLEVPRSATGRRFGLESLEIADLVVAATVDGDSLPLRRPIPIEAGRPIEFDLGETRSAPVRIELLVERRLYGAFDAARLRDPRGGLRDTGAWPEPLASSRTTVPVAVR